MLYLITNRHMVSSGEYFHVIGEAAKGGVDAVILREKDLAFEVYVEIASKVKEALKGTETNLILHSHEDAIGTCDADGLHITFGDLMKKRAPYVDFVGVSVHSIEEAMTAEKHGVNYLLASHIFDTDCKKGEAPKGLGLIEEIKARVSTPVVALGGIQPGNVQQVMAAGADGIAVMSYIMTANDSYRAATLLKQKLM